MARLPAHTSTRTGSTAGLSCWAKSGVTAQERARLRFLRSMVFNGGDVTSSGWHSKASSGRKENPQTFPKSVKEEKKDERSVTFLSGVETDVPLSRSQVQERSLQPHRKSPRGNSSWKQLSCTPRWVLYSIWWPRDIDNTAHNSAQRRLMEGGGFWVCVCVLYPWMLLFFSSYM